MARACMTCRQPAPPTSAETYAGQSAFSEVADSPEFVEATRRGDWESAKALMESRHIFPHPDFPKQAIVCVPPYHLYYTWQWVLGPTGYALVWLPKGCIRAVRYQGDYFSHE